MAVLTGGPSVSDEFKASSASAGRLIDRIKQLRGDGTTTATSNNIHSDVPAWVKTGAAGVGIDNSDTGRIQNNVAALGATATGAVQDANLFNQQAAAQKLLAIQQAKNAQGQKDLLKKINGIDVSGGGSSAGAKASGTRAKVIAAGKKLLGADYVYGGGHGSKPGLSVSGQAHGSKTYGVDCSGLVRYAFAKAGLGQWGGQANAATESTYGKPAPLKSLLPGDLVVKTSGGSAYHIAIYLGKGMILEAQKTGTQVHIRSIGNGQGFSGIHLNY
jgi:cell wall-associated NlpC family hydrolase